MIFYRYEHIVKETVLRLDLIMECFIEVSLLLYIGGISLGSSKVFPFSSCLEVGSCMVK